MYEIEILDRFKSLQEKAKEMYVDSSILISRLCSAMDKGVYDDGRDHNKEYQKLLTNLEDLRFEMECFSSLCDCFIKREEK